jgi:hypothetical protein
MWVSSQRIVKGSGGHVSFFMPPTLIKWRGYFKSKGERENEWDWAVTFRKKTLLIFYEKRPGSPTHHPFY